MQKKGSEIILSRLNAVRILVVLFIAVGYASTMPLGHGNPEIFAHFGYDPSWIGIQLLFFFSGFLTLKSIRRHGSATKYLKSRAVRNLPLLAVFTLITVVIIYPALGVMTENPAELAFKLGRYFFLTVTCIDPGQTLPGLLDNAKYMCLIQGAIWTFKWGMVAHIAAAISAHIGLFRNDRIILLIAIAATLLHFVVTFVQAKNGYEWLEAPAVGLRLAYIFLVGMACYAYKDKMPTTPKVKTLILTSLLSFAAFWYYLLAWTPMIEILITGFWAYSALLLATSTSNRLSFLDGWPNLALAIYLINWPASQLLLLAYPGVSPWGLVALCLPVSMLIALAAHYLVSRPSYSFARLQSLKPAF